MTSPVHARAAILLVAVPLAAAAASCGPASPTSQTGPATPSTSSTPAAGADVAPDQPALTRLVSVTTSGFTEPAELVLRDSAALAEAWRTLRGAVPGDAPPAVDFARDMVVLVALGERSSGGHTVRVDGVTVTGGAATVRYTATRPGDGCMTTMAITSPAEAVRTARVDGAVRFERRDVVQAC